jgi:hypothetical protein
MGSLREAVKGSVTLSDWFLASTGAGLQEASDLHFLRVSLTTSLVVVGAAALLALLLINRRKIERVWDLADYSFRGAFGIISLMAGAFASTAYAVLGLSPNLAGLGFFGTVILLNFGLIASKNWALRSWQNAIAKLRVFRKSFSYIV